MRGLRLFFTAWLMISFCGCFLTVGSVESQTGLQSGSIPPLKKNGSRMEEIPDWKARLELAKLLTYAGRYPEAIRAYEKVLKEKPGLMEARIEMAKAYFWSGKNDKALQLLKSIPLEELDEEALLAMADLYITTKDYANAQAIFTDHLKTHPRDHKVRLRLAAVLSWMKRYDASISHYQYLTEALPDDREIKKKYAFVLIWAGKQDEAIKVLQDALPD